MQVEDSGHVAPEMPGESVAVDLMGALQAAEGGLVEPLQATLDPFDTGIQNVELLDQAREVAIALAQTLQFQALAGQVRLTILHDDPS